jgi:phosphatidylserine synthase
MLQRSALTPASLRWVAAISCACCSGTLALHGILTAVTAAWVPSRCYSGVPTPASLACVSDIRCACCGGTPALHGILTVVTTAEIVRAAGIFPAASLACVAAIRCACCGGTLAHLACDATMETHRLAVSPPSAVLAVATPLLTSASSLSSLTPGFPRDAAAYSRIAWLCRCHQSCLL